MTLMKTLYPSVFIPKFRVITDYSSGYLQLPPIWPLPTCFSPIHPVPHVESWGSSEKYTNSYRSPASSPLGLPQLSAGLVTMCASPPPGWCELAGKGSRQRECFCSSCLDESLTLLFWEPKGKIKLVPQNSPRAAKWCWFGH